MNHRTDTDRVLQVWMADGPAAIPDRVVDVVAARIAVNRQRRTWPFPRRTNVTTQIKLIAALAAVLVVAVVGYTLLPGTTNPGGPTTAPTPTTQPTVAVSAAPTAGAVFPQWWATDSARTGAGILAAGSHATVRFQPVFTFTVPEGWVNGGDETISYDLIPDTAANAAEQAATGGLAQHVGVLRYGSPYWFCDAWEDHRGATAAEILASVVATEALATSEPVDVTIGGLTGKQVDMRLDPGWTQTCPGDSPTFDLGDMRSRVILLDTPDRGAMFINVGSLHAADHEAFLAEAMPIVESFEFAIGQ